MKLTKSPLRPSLLAKRGLDAWGRPLPQPGTMVSLPWSDHVGVYVEGIGSAHDGRVRHARVLVGGELRLVDIPLFRIIEGPSE